MKLDNKILVGTHHKTGTVWMMRIFVLICQNFGLKFFSGEEDEVPPRDFDIFFHMHSLFNLNELQMEYKGLHLIRDPRDIIVSGCFYHQKSRERWLHIKDDKFGGLTYQEKINSYDSFDDQIMFEMENASLDVIQEILNWNYANPAFYEVKYENLFLDKNLLLFHNIFTFLGFFGKSIPEILRIAYDNSLFSGKLEKSIHIRCGETRQWEKYFKSSHKARFLKLFGEALIKLEYERNDEWLNS